MNESDVQEVISKADIALGLGDYKKALKMYRFALSLLPSPFYEHDLSTSILSAIGDVYWVQSDFDKAREVFSDVLLCPGAAASEYIRLRRGQIYFELGDMKKAKTELACAYMNGGEEVFYDEEPKYLEYIKRFL